MKGLGIVSLILISLILISCGDKSNPTAPAQTYTLDTLHAGIFQNNPPDYTTQNPTNWYCNDVANPFIWLYHFNGNLVVISQITQTVTVDSIINDTALTYKGVFVLDSSVTPHHMDIHLLAPSQYQGQTIQTLYAFQPVQGSFINCWVMENTPGAARPTTIDQTSNSFLNLRYYQ
ncbi:MAG: hypothetical protein WBM07_06900 [Chitinivibrionales bacterium]